jgi:hypothetical protein
VTQRQHNGLRINFEKKGSICTFVLNCVYFILCVGSGYISLEFHVGLNFI